MATLRELASVLSEHSDLLNETTILNIVLLRADQDIPASQLLAFAERAVVHQRQIRDEKSKVFPARITDVKRITRKNADGRPVGEKVQVTMETTDRDKNIQTEEITTGWIDYVGQTDPNTCRPEIAFEMAHAQWIEDIATANLNKDVFVRKAFVEGEKTKQGGAPRVVASIMTRAGRKDDADERPASRSRRSDDANTDSVERIVERLGFKWNKDFDTLAEIEPFEPADKYFEKVAVKIGLRNSDIDDFIDDCNAAEGSSVERAVRAVRQWQ